MKVAVVLPTIRGREAMFARVEKAYRDTTPAPVLYVVVRDEPNWPAACNAGTARALEQGVDAIFYGADDLVPLAGWYEAMVRCLEVGWLPAPEAVYDAPGCGRNVDGLEPLKIDDDGPPGATTFFSRVPAVRAEWARELGAWPDMDYYADLWLSVAARRLLGVETVVVTGYRFVHYWNQTGRLDTDERLQESWRRYTAAVDELEARRGL